MRVESPPEHIYIFDSAKILTGDILLSTAPKSPKSAVIRRQTKADYSHAAICTEPGLFIEAIGLGVRRFAIGRMAVRERRHACLLRLRADVPNAGVISRLAGLKAENYLSHGYWLVGALTALSKKLRSETQSRVFCSQLVAQAYREAGLALIAADPAKTHPGTFVSSKLLMDVTDDVLVIHPADVRWMSWTFLEDHDKRTLHDQEVAVKQAVHRRVAKAFRAHHLEPPVDFHSAFGALIRIRDRAVASAIDSAFACSLRREGYLSLPKKAVWDTADSFKLDQYTAEGIRSKTWTPEEKAGILLFQKRQCAIILAATKSRQFELESFR